MLACNYYGQVGAGGAYPMLWQGTDTVLTLIGRAFMYMQ